MSGLLGYPHSPPGIVAVGHGAGNGLDVDQGGLIGSLHGFDSICQFFHVGGSIAVSAVTPGYHGEIDGQIFSGKSSGFFIPVSVFIGEAGDSLTSLQVVDALASVVVQHDQVDLQTLLQACDKFGMEHLEASVSQNGVYFPVRLGNFDSQSCIDFISHAGEGIFNVVNPVFPASPDSLKIAGQASGSGHHDGILGQKLVVQFTQDPGLSQSVGMIQGIQPIYFLIPLFSGFGDFSGIAALVPSLSKLGGQGFQGQLCIGENRHSVHFISIQRVDIDGDHIHLFMLIRPFGAGAEVVEPGSDSQDQVGFGCQFIGSRSSGQAGSPHVVWIVKEHHPFSGLSFAERNVEFFRKFDELCSCIRVSDAATGYDEGFLLLHDQVSSPLNHGRIDISSLHIVDSFFKKFHRVIIDFALNILGQTESHGSHFRRVGQNSHGIDTGSHQLFRPCDPIPVFAYWFEGIVGGDVVIMRLFDLLQHRIRLPGCIGFSGQEQDRQTVGGGSSCCGNHIQGSRTDGTGDSHDLLSSLLFGKTQGNVSHSLFVLSLIVPEAVLIAFQGFPQPYHVAVAKDSANSLDELDFFPVHIDVLIV